MVWLSMVFVAALFGMIADHTNLSRFYGVMKNQAQSVGVVTGTDCAVHDSLFYSFPVGPRSYQGAYYGGCNSMPGQAILVYYDKQNPAVNVSADPTSAWWNEATTIAMGSVMFPSLMLIFFAVKSWRSAGRPKPKLI
jgi:hypothetical protein